jgi:hypothetical protein
MSLLYVSYIKFPINQFVEKLFFFFLLMLLKKHVKNT